MRKEGEKKRFIKSLRKRGRGCKERSRSEGEEDRRRSGEDKNYYVAGDDHDDGWMS